MKTIIIILFVFFTANCFSQTVLKAGKSADTFHIAVIRIPKAAYNRIKTIHDSAAFQSYMQKGGIDFEPVMQKDSTYILSPALLTSPDFSPIITFLKLKYPNYFKSITENDSLRIGQ